MKKFILTILTILSLNVTMQAFASSLTVPIPGIANATVTLTTTEKYNWIIEQLSANKDKILFITLQKTKKELQRLRYPATITMELKDITCAFTGRQMTLVLKPEIAIQPGMILDITKNFVPTGDNIAAEIVAGCAHAIQCKTDDGKEGYWFMPEWCVAC